MLRIRLDDACEAYEKARRVIFERGDAPNATHSSHPLGSVRF
jgi:hypothetical protein